MTVWNNNNNDVMHGLKFYTIEIHEVSNTKGKSILNSLNYWDVKDNLLELKKSRTLTVMFKVTI